MREVDEKQSFMIAMDNELFMNTDLIQISRLLFRLVAPSRNSAVVVPRLVYCSCCFVFH